MTAAGTVGALAAQVGAPPELEVGGVASWFPAAGEESPTTDGPGEASPTADGPGDSTPRTADSAAAVAEGEQRTLLLIVGEDGARPASLTLLAGDAADGRPTLLHIPVGTLAQIPGFGLERIGSAAVVGDAELVEATVENALGLDIDARTSVTPDLLADFLDRAGGLEVDLPTRIVDRSADDGERVLFPAGPQRLDGQDAGRLWTAAVPGGDEFAQVARQQIVWDALLDRLAGDETVRTRMLADGAPQLRPEGPTGVDSAATIVEELVDARSAGTLGVELLPVTVLGADDAEPTYRIDGEKLDGIVAASLAPSRPAAPASERVRVQILNGVGTPGIGREVDRRLDGEPVQVVRSDNARDFEQETTRILIYRDAPAIRAAAEQVRARLGVGTIELSRQPQSVVDLTIVVGSDFAATPAR